MEVMKCQFCPSAKATFSCLCRPLPNAFCLKCIETHTGDDGKHVLFPMNKEDRPGNGGEICGKCGLQSAEVICCCSYPVQTYCRLCKAIHVAESAESQHTFLPLIMKEKIESPEGLIEMKHRRMEVEMAEGLLKLNLVNVKRCEAALNSRRADLAASSFQYSTQQCLSLSHFKKLLQELIGAGVAEAKAKIMELDRVPREGVAGLLATYTQTQNPDSLTLFKCDVTEKMVDCAKLVGVDWESRLMTNGDIRESFKKSIEPEREQVLHTPFKSPLEYNNVEEYILACRPTYGNVQSRETLEDSQYLNYYKTHLHCLRSIEEAQAETTQTLTPEDGKLAWVQHATDLLNEKMSGRVPLRFVKDLKRGVIASYNSQKTKKNVEKRVSRLKSMIAVSDLKGKAGLVYVDVTNGEKHADQGKKTGHSDHSFSRKKDCKEHAADPKHSEEPVKKKKKVAPDLEKMFDEPGEEEHRP